MKCDVAFNDNAAPVLKDLAVASSLVHDISVLVKGPSGDFVWKEILKTPQPSDEVVMSCFMEEDEAPNSGAAGPLLLHNRTLRTTPPTP